MANTEYNLGNYWRMTPNGMNEAEKAYRRTLVLQERLVGEQPELADYQHRLARTYGNLAIVLDANQKRDAAEELVRKAVPIFQNLVDEHPKVPQYRVDLGNAYNQLASLWNDPKRPEVKLEWYAKAIQALEAVQRMEAGNVWVKQFLPLNLYERATALSSLGRHAEALADWDRIIALQGGSGEDQFRLGRALALAHLGDHKQATAEAKELASRAEDRGAILCDLARVYALSTAAVMKDRKTEAASQNQLAEQYAVQAVALLEKAHAASFFKDPKKAERLKEDPDLAPLGSRGDFKKLVAEVDSKAGAK